MDPQAPEIIDGVAYVTANGQRYRLKDVLELNNPAMSFDLMGRPDVAMPPRADAPDTSTPAPEYQFGDVGAASFRDALANVQNIAGSGGEVTRSLLPESWQQTFPDGMLAAGDYGLAGLTGLLGAVETGTGYGAEVAMSGVEGVQGLLGLSPRYAPGGGAQALQGDLMAMFEGSGFAPEGRMVASIAGAAQPVIADEAQRAVRGVMDFAADEFGGVPVPSINRLDPNEWMTRLQSSLPASWLDKKYDQPQWHGISAVSSDLPPDAMAPVLRSTETLQPQVMKTIEDFVGRTGIPALGDRSIAGNEVLGIGNLAYSKPVRSLGGADFMRERGTGIWANAGQQAQDLAGTAQAVINAGGDPALIYTAMGPQSADFSTMMAEAVMNQYDPQMIDPAAAAKFDEAVRKADVKFTSISNPDFLDGLTGTDRWNLWQLMDKAALKKAGFPDINMARRSITDPRLLDVVPFDAGLTVGRPTGGLLAPDAVAVPHPTYPSQLDGTYEGGLEQSIPGAILWRDFFNRRRAAGASPGGDQRSFLMNANGIAQAIDQQTVDEYGQFLEGVKGLSDPSSPLRLWRGLLND